MLIKMHSASTPPNGPFTEELSAFIETVRNHFRLPSISIGVVEGDQTFIKCFGNAKCSGEPATEDTLYYLASVTKSFTATTLLSVLEELGPDSKINLQTKISSILPDDFVLPDEYATKHATLEDALGHVLGMATSNLCYGGEGYTVRDAVRCLRHLPMNHELRQKLEYLNMGYMTIQHVIETLTGKPIEDAHHRHIWGPLGMNSTFPKLSDAEAAPNTLAAGHEWYPVEQKLQETAYAQDYPLIGGGGLISSIKDLTAYLKAVVNGKLPLSNTSQKELFKPRTIYGSSGDAHESTILYAAGWMISQCRGKRFIHHNGGIDGFSSQLAFFPDQKWGLAILTNGGTNGYYVVQNAMARLIDDFLKVDDSERKNLITKYDQALSDAKKRYLDTRTTLYPSVPQPPLPLPLPLYAYAGSYHNAGYRTIELSVADAPKDFPIAETTKQVLHAELNRLVHSTLDLEHVSGDFFIGWTDTKKTNFANKGGIKSQAILGSDGTVEKWGIDIESNGRLIWFDKVD